MKHFLKQLFCIHDWVILRTVDVKYIPHTSHTYDWYSVNIGGRELEQIRQCDKNRVQYAYADQICSKCSKMKLNFKKLCQKVAKEDKIQSKIDLRRDKAAKKGLMYIKMSDKVNPL